MSEAGDTRSTLFKFFDVCGQMIDVPITMFREKIVEPNHEKNKSAYFHRNFNRVPTIDECGIDDQLCFFEAQEQFKRDRLVDTEVMTILRQRRMECEVWYGVDHEVRCAKIAKEYDDCVVNWYTKYGDLGAAGTAKDAYMKQKHRLIWERRHGPVGSGKKTSKLD